MMTTYYILKLSQRSFTIGQISKDRKNNNLKQRFFLIYNTDRIVSKIKYTSGIWQIR